MLKVIGLCIMFVLGALLALIGMVDENNGRGWRFTIVGLFLISLAVLSNLV